MPVLIHTANTLKHHHLAFKKDPANELLQSLEDTVSLGKHTTTQHSHAVLITDREDSAPQEDRADLEITAKLFLNQNIDPASATHAIDSLRELLKTEAIDNLILSVHGTSENPALEEELEEEFILRFLAVWKVLEAGVEAKKLKKIGVADFSRLQLEQIWNRTVVKPSICQVNVESCCVIPKELVEFAKANNVDLLTHSDTPDFIKDHDLQEVFHKYTIQECLSSKISWVIRYASLVKQRGVVHDKAFVIFLKEGSK